MLNSKVFPGASGCGRLILIMVLFTVYERELPVALLTSLILKPKSADLVKLFLVKVTGPLKAVFPKSSDFAKGVFESGALIFWSN